MHAVFFFQAITHYLYISGCKLHASRHHPRNDPQCQGLQAQQATDAEGGKGHREAGEATEDGTGEEEATKAPGL